MQWIIRGSVTAREEEVFFVVPSSLSENSSKRIFHAFTGRDSWFTFVEHARSNYQCLPVVSTRLLQPHYNVTAHTETTGNSNLHYERSVESTRSNLSVVFGVSDVST